MNQGQGCEYYDQRATSIRRWFSLRVHAPLGVVTYGELPRIPVALYLLSTVRIRIATARAAVVNVILMNRNNYSSRFVSGRPQSSLKE
jgi:hypothetical protein